MLTTTLRRNVRDGSLDNLEERLLNTFAADISRNRRVVSLSSDLVDLVDVDDTALRAFQVVVCILQQLHDDILDVFTDVAGFGKRRRVRDGEGNVQNLREGLSEQRFATAGRAEQKDIRLLKLDLTRAHLAIDALVVIVNGNRENFLRPVLPDHILVEDRFDLRGLW